MTIAEHLPTVAAAASAGRRFFRWWTSELKALVPAHLAAVFAARRSTIVLDLFPERLVVGRRNGDTYAELARFAFTGSIDAALGGEVRAALARFWRGDNTAELRLAEGETLRKKLELPLKAARGDLRKVLLYEIDRQTPFLPEQVSFDYRIVDAAPGNGRVVVELAVVPRETIDRAIAVARIIGLRPTAIVVDTGSGAPGRFDFLPRSERRKRASLPARLSTALAGLAALLAVAFVVSLFERQSELRLTLSQKVAQAKAAAEKVKSLQQDIGRQAEQLQFLPRKRRIAPTTLVLNEVTWLLPDDAWLYEFQIGGREVTLRGYAPLAVAVFDLLGRTPAFTNARFRSPVTQGPNRDVERFDISFDLKAD